MIKSTIIDAAIKSILRGEIEVTGYLCPTLKSPKSSCHICMEVCPANAISMSEGMIDEAKCFNCGLCISACPSGVFLSRLESDANIVELAMSAVKNSTDGASVIFACGMAHNEMGPVVPIRCLGRLTENILLWLKKNGITNITFESGDCPTCSLSRGDAVFKYNHRLARLIAESAGIKWEKGQAQEIRKEENAGEKKEKNISVPSGGFSRRDFFKRLRGEGILKVGEMVTESIKMPPKENVKTSGKSPRRNLLKKILDGMGNGSIYDGSGGIYIPFGDVSISAECIGCDVCQILCPTAALYKEKSEDKVKLMFSYDRCISCGLCAEICLGKAIKVQPLFDPKKIVNPSPRELISFRNKTCSVCSTEFASRSDDEEICFFCSKRGKYRGG
ncbi:MAG: 4Fe-4S binding protein [Candidatus Schekmanbacteria bacterium]|nr:4Fe-4S binding protein [Candidatus Schekmanbacteria bacterium]